MKNLAFAFGFLVAQRSQPEPTPLMAEFFHNITLQDILLGVFGILFGIPLLVFGVMLLLYQAGLIKPPAKKPEPTLSITTSDNSSSTVFKQFWIQGLLLVLLSLMLVFGLRGLSSAITNPNGMVLIPAGTFIMGSSDEEIMWAAETFYSESLDFYRDETPAHPVTLDAFFIDKTEVTVGNFKDYMAETGQDPPRYFDSEKFKATSQPVVGVTWKQADQFCAWAGKRLPTEAEWEKAARGTDTRMYPWGKKPEEKLGNFRGKSDGFRYVAPVGSFPESKSPYGVLDLAGNVWEWTDSWYGPHPGNTVKSDLYGERFKVMKGGSWFSNLDLARITVRGKALPNQKMNYIGFRCARSASVKTGALN